MLIDIEEFYEHLKSELPDFDFTSIHKIEDYKEESEIYEVSFNCSVLDNTEALSYRMVVGYPSKKLTTEELKNNFVKVAEFTYNGRKKDREKEGTKTS